MNLDLDAFAAAAEDAEDTLPPLTRELALYLAEHPTSFDAAALVTMTREQRERAFPR